MLGLRRPFDLVMAFAAGAAVSALGFHSAPMLAGQRPASSAPGALASMRPIIIMATPPVPSPDSLAALLVASAPRDAFPRPGSRAETALLLDLVSSAERMGSRPEAVALLDEIARLDRIEPPVISALARAAARLSSWSARERLFRTLIERHAHSTGGSRHALLDAIAGMQPSAGRAAVLEAFVTRPRLTEAALAEALAQVNRLPAQSERLRVLLAAARVHRLRGAARSVYLRAANTISRDRDRLRALGAIQARSSEHDG